METFALLSERFALLVHASYERPERFHCFGVALPFS